MKATKLRFSIVALLAASSMVLASCGDSAGTTSTAVPTTGVSGETSGKIKIVSSLPRTGASSKQTDDVVAGIKMALEERSGKVGNFTIEYSDWDDASATLGKWDPAVEAENANKAINDADVMVYIGTFNSGAAKISIPLLNQAGLVMISPANTAPELTKPGFDDTTLNSLYPKQPRNYFRVIVADDVQGAAAANWAQKLGYKKVYIINDQETYGKGVAGVFEKQFKAIGGEVLANEGIDYKQPEFRALMSKVKEKGADLVYFGGLIETGGPQLLKDLRATDPNIGFMGPDGIQTSEFPKSAGEENAEGAYATVGGKDVKDLQGKGADFFKNFLTKMGHEADPYSIFGYEAMNVSLDAIAKAGVKNRSAIMEAIRGTKDYDGALGKWSFDANGDTTLSDMRGFKILSGKFVFQEYLSINKP